ncbi:heme oxygenase (biliverdin-producing) [Dolichospermum sp. LEGE 00240]|jgi:heme oxygenase (biliverdin-producing, ferredoxin)|uniref:biliverdin-producing heme oxygenase n=1 Tax=Dolichospermum sp. LEGE 00240 TaxID=1828603 RepID=UPI00187DE68A|nr:heme oxygenase (biliverdin-producing) [Dolichospermum sp. LEGE 00240]MDM3847466.1 heme oxygenase (biliverdin-producing) [Aphanizomenon gracile PMC638.10]MDM3852043.1 heme oxygenase (biliverdin-producing) [Aphanizomenon gracile PMC627.10]MDM3854937.1 heme oxygenase (biliverdin-producing) [Aphanizomenon gracile PMC649.10]MDM3860241.1 heme oxygenase (biliverdin-producing) [Aphanizomenon gracile PMC644.10]MBE9251807.1 heme oxygenase (biliverdin-producing) [Dolichospermum sp. LEGE 00240]
MSNDLAMKLRVGTQQAHTDSENLGFMKCFVKGVVDRDCFIQLLRNFYFVYSELEAAIEKHKQHPVISLIYFPELNRQSSLEQDMLFYYGSQWHKRIAPSPAAQAYIARIQQISTHEPALLLAHSYTRYLGDLSGGQMLQKIAQSALKLSGHEGTSFYNFQQIPDKQTFKGKYRQALDKVNIDDTTADKIVAEANHAFKLNMQILQELESILIQALGRATYNDLV